MKVTRQVIKTNKSIIEITDDERHMIMNALAVAMDYGHICCYFEYQMMINKLKME